MKITKKKKKKGEGSGGILLRGTKIIPNKKVSKKDVRIFKQEDYGHPSFILEC